MMVGLCFGFEVSLGSDDESLRYSGHESSGTNVDVFVWEA